MRLLIALLLASSVFGQHNTDRAESTEQEAKSPPGVTLALRLKNNQTKFRVGETITLELSFSSTVPKKYVLDNATYDRSGRLDIDEFIVAPEQGTEDPLEDYFNSGDGFIGGGISGSEELTEKPHVITAELNEWIRFDTPGRYRLYVSSDRVSKKREQYVAGNPEQLSVISNFIEFEIVAADAKWAAQQLAVAREKLSVTNYESHRAGCRLLRFLGTSDAVREMVKRLGTRDSECEGSYRLGLIGSPHRALALREMERALVSPDFAVSSGFLYTLSLLASLDRSGPLPPYPAGNDALEKEWQAKASERHENRRHIRLNYLRQLAAALVSKTAAARPASVETFLSYTDEAKSDGALEKEIQEIAATVPDLFERLTPDAQRQLLEYRWKTLAQDRMLPILKKLLAQPDRKEFNDDYERRTIRSLALRRLYELSPDEGRTLIIEEISKPKPRVTMDVLRILPDETLPELDAALLTNFERSVAPNSAGDAEIIAALIERYATDSLSSRVEAAYKKAGVGRWACRIEESLLAYLLRVNPASGGELLNQALAARGIDHTRCYASVLVDVAALQYTPEVERAAFQMLEEDVPELVTQAADVLKKFGSANAEEKLWLRFERWNESCRSRATELRKVLPSSPIFGAPQISSEALIEQWLSVALMTGKGWLADPDKLKRVRSLCLTEHCEKDVDGFIGAWHTMISIGVSSESDEPYLISVAHYQLDSIAALRRKLLQFPRGTKFVYQVDTTTSDPVRRDKIFAELKSYLESNGMKLELVE